MAKFTKMFEADMQNSIDNLVEADTKKKRTIKTGAVVGGGLAGGLAGHTASTVATYKRFGKMKPEHLAKAAIEHNKLFMKAARSAAKSGFKAGAVGTAVGGAAGAGISHLRNRKKNVSESVLAEVRGRIAARKIEEGILAGGAFAVGNAIEKLRKLKMVKQIGGVGEGIKNAVGSAGTRFGTFRKGGATAGQAFKNAASDTGNLLKDTIKTNPLGAAAVGGTAGLSAWGLKKPKKVQEAAGFDFSKLKDKKGKDKGKDKAKNGKPAFFGKGKDDKKDGEVNPAAEAALAKAKGKKKGKGKVPPQFLKNIKGGDKGGPPVEEGKKEVPAFFKK